MWASKPTSHERVATEPIAWMTTVSADGVPSTAPVWFILEPDETITVFSRDPSVRIRNLDANDRVTLHLEGDGRGGAIVVLNGSAIVDRTAPRADEHEAFITKYRGFLDRYGWTPAWFSQNYPTRIRMTINSIRGS